MSRIRTIKPDFFLDDELAELSPLTRLLFIGLWTLVDCQGRMEDRPKRIRAQLHPFDDGDTDAMLQALHDAGFITRYEADGKRYLEIRTFTKHQRLTGKEAEACSEMPAPEPYATANRKPSGNIGETLGKDFSFTNAQEGKGREGKGKGKEEEAAQAPFASPPPPPPPSPSMPKPEPAAAPKAARQPKPIKAPIPADWMPAETTYALLEKHGIERPFAEGCLDEFRLYWTERGESRPGWEASFVNNVKRQWAHRTLSTTPTPRTSQRYAPPPRAMTPEAAHFEAILKNLNHPVIEGEIAHELH